MTIMTISVITINRNNREGLLKTIQSVVSQTVPPDEFIIIDGASTDGSADLLAQYAGHITYSVSEPDKGIYNAMNKGVAAAKADYCIFMNSGDCFCGPDIIQKLKDAGVSADIICGNARILEDPPKINRLRILRYEFFTRVPSVIKALLYEPGFLKSIHTMSPLR